MGSLTPSTVLTRNAAIFASKVDDELVMMDEDRGRYYGLNPVAAKIWECLESSQSYETLLTRLVETHDVSRERCDAELRPFLLEMVDRGLVRCS